MEIRPTVALCDLCILASLVQGDKFLEDIRSELDTVICIQAPDLCICIGQLAEKGLLEPYAWKRDDEDMFYYRITNLGRALLEKDRGEWDAFKLRVDGFLSKSGAMLQAFPIG